MPLTNEYLPVKLNYMYNGWYQQELFDYVQSHAVYGLTEYDVDAVKKELKSKGATRFRVVGKVKNGIRILCYLGIKNPKYKDKFKK